MKVPRAGIRKARIEMLPLIDIVFLLLVFFIYAMLSMAVHRGLPVTLPLSSTAEIDKRLVLSVTVNEDGTAYVDETLVQPDDLTEVLMRRGKGREESPGVLLFAHRALSYQELFRVLDMIREAGITRISLQAEAGAGW
ncbi:MAG: ExbD/TolR family protein [Desulfobacteraceae bacterium]